MSAHVMTTRKADRPGPCDVVIAQFVFGPQLCLIWADLQTEDDGEWFYVCEDHAAGRDPMEAL